MNILVPLNDIELADIYKEAGAKEVYMGFFDDNWAKHFGEYADINRMSGFGRAANKYSFDELPKIIERVKSKGLKIFITLNANCYSKKELEYMEDNYFPVLKASDADGVIVSELETAVSVIAHGIKATVSTMGAVYNSDIAQVYKKAGVSRIILPRDMNISDITSIVTKVSGMEYEVFFMRNGCVFSDAYCLGMHRPECGATCTYLRIREEHIVTCKKTFQDTLDLDLNDFLYNTAFQNDSCAMCALYSFRQIGIAALKIVGRSDDTEAIYRDISDTAENIRIAETCKSNDEYLERMIMPKKYPIRCRLGLSCYYPEIRFPERSVNI